MQDQDLKERVSRRIEGPTAWRGAEVDAAAVTVTLDAAERDAVLRFADEYHAHPLPAVLVTETAYESKRFQQVAHRVRKCLQQGPGFCLVDRLPVDEMPEEAARAAYWLLSSLVSRPVAQKLDGTMIYDVHDTGKKADPGSGVRPDKTNIDLTFHNDNSYNALMPEVVALLCLRPAKSGGRSRVISFDTVFNTLCERAPDALPRLFQPFWFDRQREHFPDEEPTFAAPIFSEVDGKIQGRLGLHQVRNAYAMRGEELDPAGREAVSALEAVFADPELCFEFDMQAGQIQYVQNRAIGHSRTRFEDFEAPDRRRHLVRLWMRDEGHRSYPG